ncbi:Crossover junction endodeoxyribonuclease RuvC [bacterium HR40]|nr:Crossover junction endodeoxyribonuclease RuvC [bacterium HR40]
MIRILGLDPGLRRTGWGVVDSGPGVLRFVACGVVTAPEDALLPLRLSALYAGLREVIGRFLPAEAAIEETVVNRNAGSSLKLGHARGVALLALAHAGLPVAEYAAKRVKRAVTGTGGATKEQVAAMVRILLPNSDTPTGDAADALAVAICHAHERETLGRLALMGAP